MPAPFTIRTQFIRKDGYLANTRLMLIGDFLLLTNELDQTLQLGLETPEKPLGFIRLDGTQLIFLPAKKALTLKKARQKLVTFEPTFQLRVFDNEDARLLFGLKIAPPFLLLK